MKVAFVGWSFYCILCLSAEEDMDHILLSCNIALSFWSHFFEMLGFPLAPHKDLSEIIKVFLLHPPFRDKGNILWHVWGVWFVVRDLLGERNDGVFRGVEKDLSDVWSHARFYVFSLSFWRMVMKSFYNYSLDLILHS